ncbi:MAG: HNH endonuclease [Solirubrobacterales bacterium]
MPKRPCLVCGQLANGSYCDRHRPKRLNQREHGKTWKSLRARALLRDGGRCVVCGTTRQLEAHHVVPVAKGGRDELVNLETRCEDCHRATHRGR